jgi:hypothetical protein
MTMVATLFLCVLALPAVAASLYLLVFTLLSATPRAPALSRRLRFRSSFIPRKRRSSGAIRSVRRLDWPADGYR